MSRKRGFTLIELMVVVLIVAVLAAVLVPMMRGRIDAAKWSEANAACAQIRTAIRAYVAEKGPNFSDWANLQTNWRTLVGIPTQDLEGRYFTSVDYSVTNIEQIGDNAYFGSPAITVTGSKPEAPAGTGNMAVDGSWNVTTT